MRDYFSTNLFKACTVVNVEYYIAVLCTLRIMLNKDESQVCDN